MRSYYRIMLGRKSAHAEQCIAEGFIGADFGLDIDLTPFAGLSVRDFNKKVVPLLLSRFPDKPKMSACLAGGALWTFSQGLQQGDVVLCPDGQGSYAVGLIRGSYEHKPSGPLMHRRGVTWMTRRIPRAAMSQALRNSTGSIGTVSEVSSFREEIDALMETLEQPRYASGSKDYPDPTSFVLESHLEDFLFENWKSLPLAKEFDIFMSDGEPAKQFQTNTGRIDLLAVSKDQRTLLVVELKRGRTSDAVVGQLLRYMSEVKEDVAEPHQTVKGLIIAGENDPKLELALRMTQNVEFLRYELSFKLHKV